MSADSPKSSTEEEREPGEAKLASLPAIPQPQNAKPLRRSSSSERGNQTDKKKNPPSGGGPVNERIEPRKSTYTELTRDRAEKLATLRRGWFDEFTWAALAGLAASAPSTVHSYVIASARDKFSLELPEAIDFGVSLVFAVLAIVGLFYGKNRGPNAMQYLEKHFGKDPDAEESKPFFRLPNWLSCLRRHK